ncbi:MAG: signal recognition particle-docking protein FtsY [Planctomycetota bacterium]|nr:signal recognition particle-docking protein FtsY [Planctomycetota bacterium]
MGFLGKLIAGLKKTRAILTTPVTEIFRIGRRVDENLLQQLEERLILADVGPRLAKEIVARVREKYRDREIERPEDITDFLKTMLAGDLSSSAAMALNRNLQGPTVVLLIGVNGTGKTTTAAKLARFLKESGESVLLAAADTFRAAAREQLEIWAQRVQVDIVRHAAGADPAAVVFDACDAAVARQVSFVLVDTAGRLHTKANLMQQLAKISRVAGKKIAGAPHEVLLVLDATTGQNALSQARLFTDGVGVTGLILTKLDGTAKGGVALAIHREIGKPIKFVGTGEKDIDLAPFNPREFCEALFAAEDTGGKPPAMP